jgi:RND family efflux transporter MFP subunit
MRNKLIIAGIATAATLVLLVAGPEGRAQQQAAPPAAPPAAVEVAKASAADLGAVQWVPGTVVSREDARIASELSGRVRTVAEVGDRIDSGGVIAHLDDEALALAEREAAAALARIRSQLDYQERQVARLERLKSNSSIAETQLDEARSQRDMLEADRAGADVALAEARRRVREATIRAPFAGVVVERAAQRGEMVAAGAMVVRLVNTEHLEVTARAPIALGAGIDPGDAVSVRSGERTEQVAIRAVVPVGDAQSRQLEVRIQVDDGSWPIGTAVEVALGSGEAREVVAVPRDALVLRGSETFVFRVGPDNKAERITVQTGDSSGDLVEVKSGIAAGDTLVVRGAERLAPGQAVAVRERS